MSSHQRGASVDAAAHDRITPTLVRLVITGAALGLLAAHFVSPRLQFDAFTLGLAGLAVLPWLSSVLESAKFGQLEVKFREVERKQDEQRKKLDDALAFLARNFVTDDELVHLQKLAARTPFPFNKCAPFEAELRRLLALGLIGRRPGKGMRSLFKDGDDVQHHLEITAQGTAYLEHRRSLSSPEG
jgi:hypothetical protein